MKYSTKIAIIPYDRYQRLCESKAQTDIPREDSMSDRINMSTNTHKTNDPEPSSSSNTESITSQHINEARIESKPNVNHIAQESEKISKYDEIISRLPKYLHNRAVTLLNYILDKTGITWNNDGELIIQGDSVAGSHIVDLLKDALSNSSFTPIGYDIFYKNLGNVPRSLIYNSKRRYLVGLGERTAVNTSSGNIIPPPGLPNKPEIALDKYIEGEKWRKMWKKMS